MVKYWVGSLSLLCLCLVADLSIAQIQLHNDEFNTGASLANWLNVTDEEGWGVTRLESYNIHDSVAGHMFMKPFTGSWFNEYRGAYLYKLVNGDFIITTTVTATGRDYVSLPASDYSLAGIMIREPVVNPNLPDQQNYVFMSIGQATGNTFNFEIKNTCHSSSNLNIIPINTSTATVRMARIGDAIIVLSQFPGGAWEVRNRYDRTESACSNVTFDGTFSETVQIGLVTYTDWPKVQAVGTTFHNTHTLHPDSLGGDPDPAPGTPYTPDLIGQYDYVRFDSVSVPAPFQGMDLTDAMQVSDADLLSFLGYTNQAHCPDLYHLYSPIDHSFMEVHAGTVLSAENQLSNQSNVSLSAGESIELMPGFSVDLNTSLQIELGGCP
ncbi:MAG: hypothetical protein HKN87_23920 [Saprospiraceae bacterium]|nr:hypothetical protein [Saprospiraceae bacterium]